jgi:hypothetical protein
MYMNNLTVDFSLSFNLSTDPYWLEDNGYGKLEISDMSVYL